MLRKTAVLLLTVLVLASGFSYADNAPSSWAVEAIDYLRDNDLVESHYLNDFKKPITRREFATVVIQVLEKKLSKMLVEDPDAFTDISDSYIQKAKYYKIISGMGDGRFNPSGLITREQVAILFDNTLSALSGLDDTKQYVVYVNKTPQFDDEKDISEWARKSVRIAYFNNIISGTGAKRFSPKGTLTREQAFVMLKRLVDNMTYPQNIQDIIDANEKCVVAKKADIKIVPWYYTRYMPDVFSPYKVLDTNYKSFYNILTNPTEKNGYGFTEAMVGPTKKGLSKLYIPEGVSLGQKDGKMVYLGFTESVYLKSFIDNNVPEHDQVANIEKFGLLVKKYERDNTMNYIVKKDDFYYVFNVYNGRIVKRYVSIVNPVDDIDIMSALVY